jgi:hypothetical protein
MALGNLAGGRTGAEPDGWPPWCSARDPAVSHASGKEGFRCGGNTKFRILGIVRVAPPSPWTAASLSTLICKVAAEQSWGEIKALPLVSVAESSRRCGSLQACAGARRRRGRPIGARRIKASGCAARRQGQPLLHPSKACVPAWFVTDGFLQGWSFDRAFLTY